MHAETAKHMTRAAAEQGSSDSCTGVWLGVGAGGREHVSGLRHGNLSTILQEGRIKGTVSSEHRFKGRKC